MHSQDDLWADWLQGSLRKLNETGLYRTLRPTIPGPSCTQVTVTEQQLAAWMEGREPPRGRTSQTEIESSCSSRTIKLFSLNDYLGLSTHPRVRLAAAAAARRFGNGPRASALVAGYTVHHQELEIALSSLKHTEDALLFPSGFAANEAVVSSLARSGDIDIFSDELNHASIIDGIKLAKRDGARLFTYRHGDLEHLEQLLTSTAASSGNGRRRMVVTDSLFSMDGDIADLNGLVNLKSKHGFLLVVDEAHATLVCGSHGGGVSEAAGVGSEVDLHVGTLSKAFGASGGFVACSSAWKKFMTNQGRTQVFSTSLPIPVVASAHEALRTAEEEPWRRQHLWRLTYRLGRKLGVVATSPIIPLVIGSEIAAVEASLMLLSKGYHVPAIRPPTVPAGTSRLRISLSADHSFQDVDGLVEAMVGAQLSEAQSKM
jgi:8-amino-7-oxononanoate synthase